MTSCFLDKGPTSIHIYIHGTKTETLKKKCGVKLFANCDIGKVLQSLLNMWLPSETWFQKVPD
jgi:hypothetical protein